MTQVAGMFVMYSCLYCISTHCHTFCRLCIWHNSM